MEKKDFKDVAFSRVVTLARKTVKEYEHPTGDFNAFMYDYLLLMEKEIYKMKRNCLKDSLSTSQSEGTELSLKVPSQSSDKPCPECAGIGKKNYNALKETTVCPYCGGTGKARL